MKIIDEIISFDDIMNNYHKTEDVHTFNELIHNRTISYSIVCNVLKKRGVYRSGNTWYKKIDDEYYIVDVICEAAIEKFNKYLKKAIDKQYQKNK